jgi:hypothetical protein
MLDRQSHLCLPEEKELQQAQSALETLMDGEPSLQAGQWLK